jgi:flagellar protein FlgJ
MSLDHARAITDFQGLAALKSQARGDREGAVDEVARQFESLFIQMALERMRETSFGGGLLDSRQSLFYRDLYDKQLAMNMSSAGGIGLAEAIKRQLTDAAEAAGRERSLEDYLADPVPGRRPAQAADDASPTGAAGGGGSFSGPQDFLARLRPAAAAGAAELGVPAEALLAQAALETGWGRHVIAGRDGSSTHNLFNIKADSRWDGARVSKTTLEYRDGVPLKTRADFRSYRSFEESFTDYVAFIRGNPRYRDALAAAQDPRAYLAELQKAGYATDPAYARKIAGIMGGAAMAPPEPAFKTEPVVPL